MDEVKKQLVSQYTVISDNIQDYENKINQRISLVNQYNQEINQLTDEMHRLEGSMSMIKKLAQDLNIKLEENG